MYEDTDNTILISGVDDTEEEQLRNTVDKLLLSLLINCFLNTVYINEVDMLPILPSRPFNLFKTIVKSVNRLRTKLFLNYLQKFAVLLIKSLIR